MQIFVITLEFNTEVIWMLKELKLMSKSWKNFNAIFKIRILSISERIYMNLVNARYGDKHA